MNPQDSELNEKLRERLAQLPKVVQDAILSADVEQRLRMFADTNKLHIDQWQVFENEVMLTLLGFQPIEKLQENIKTHVGVADDTAQELAENVNSRIFEPIRQELERQLEHPKAQEKEVSAVGAAAQQQIQSAEEASSPETTTPKPDTAPNTTPAPSAAVPAPTMQPTPAPAAPAPAPAVVPATPPSLVPDIKVTRPSESTAYKPGEASTARKSVTDDPYREPIS